MAAITVAGRGSTKEGGVEGARNEEFMARMTIYFLSLPSPSSPGAQRVDGLAGMSISADVFAIAIRIFAPASEDCRSKVDGTCTVHHHVGNGMR